MTSYNDEISPSVVLMSHTEAQDPRPTSPTIVGANLNVCLLPTVINEKKTIESLCTGQENYLQSADNSEENTSHNEFWER